jgi:single-stranded-DNA-specific exonuclease
MKTSARSDNARPVRPRQVPDSTAIGELGPLDPLLARILAARGIRSPTELDYSLGLLAPVGSMPGIHTAIDLLLKFRERRIVVIGDFDADGATSTALVLRCLRQFGYTDVSYLVPNRFDFGYGLTPEIVRVAAQRSPDLLLTVDSGISCVAGAEEARRLGMQVLVTDHHLPGSTLPAAAAIVNPNLQGSGFASPNLAGVGVAFYLMAALGRQLELQGQDGASRIPGRFLDLVALGTVADVVALDHNNRILVSQGLRRIRAGHAVAGIAALLEQAGRQPDRTVSADLGFVVGPRLNAAGRLEDMSIGIECLLTDDRQNAGRFAAILDDINRDRQSIESGMRKQAFEYVDSIGTGNLPDCLCVFDPRWHQGVVGLIASRVRERCHRPAIAFARSDNGELKGSARSVPGVHIRDLLEGVATTHPGLIGRFGGHAMAAGLSLAEGNFASFAAAVAKQLKRLYPDADFSGVILTDGPLPGSALNLEFAKLLREAGPWGAGFAEPLFSGEFEIVEQRTVGDSHLKLKVRPPDHGQVIDAIAFRQAGPAYRGHAQLTYRLDINEYRGSETPQLVVEQIVSIA